MVLLPMVVFIVISTIQNKGIEIEFDANLLSSTSPLKWNVFGNWVETEMK
jgi:hypothetical protein